MTLSEIYFDLLVLVADIPIRRKDIILDEVDFVFKDNVQGEAWINIYNSASLVSFSRNSDVLIRVVSSIIEGQS